MLGANKKEKRVPEKYAAVGCGRMDILVQAFAEIQHFLEFLVPLC
jgi:hypothetical protein